MTGFTKSVLKLSAGNVLAQILTVATLPVIARLYPPASFGIFAVFNSLLLILIPIGTMQFEQALLLPEEDDDALNVLALSMTSAAAVCLVVLACVLLVRTIPALSGFFGIDGLGGLIWLLPPTAMLASWQMSVRAWGIRQCRFGQLSTSKVLDVIVNRSMALGSLPLFSASSWGLILARIGGVVGANLYLLERLFRKAPARLSALSFSRMKDLAVRYSHFPLFATGSNLLNTMTRELPMVIIAAFFGASVAGQFALGERAVRAPMLLIGMAINQVYIQRAASLRNDPDRMAEQTMRLFGVLFQISLLINFTLLLFAGDLFSAIFGSQWRSAGQLVQILSPAFFFIILYVPVHPLFIVFEKQRQKFAFDLVDFAVRIALPLAVARTTDSWLATVAALALASIISTNMLFVYLTRIMHLSLGRFGLMLIRNSLLLSPYILFAILARTVFTTPFPVTCLLVGTALALQVLLLFAVHKGSGGFTGLFTRKIPTTGG